MSNSDRMSPSNDRDGDNANTLITKQSIAVKNRAESLFSIPCAEIAKMSGSEIAELLFELQDYHIELQVMELKMRNDELNNIHRELAASRDEYEQLYDFSPTAYLTLDIAGHILKANTAAAILLNRPKQNLISA